MSGPVIPPPRRRAAVRSDSPWMLTAPSPTAEMRLFCFPYSGCGATMFRQWPRAVGPAEMIPLQLPGRENRTREPHFGTYEALADALLDDLPRWLDRPYAVFGHCGGALPAFETVRRIHERGLPMPAHVFVSSQVAPQDGPRGRFLELTRDGLAGELGTLLRELGSGRPPPELLELYLEVLVADVAANKAYRKDVTPLDTRITVVGWDADVEVPHELMGGWSAWAPAAKTVLPGTHYTFLGAPAGLIDLMAGALAR